MSPHVWFITLQGESSLMSEHVRKTAETIDWSTVCERGRLKTVKTTK
jgi:hypothetical protein